MHRKATDREDEQRRVVRGSRYFDEQRPGENLEQHRSGRHHEESQRRIVAAEQSDQHERQSKQRHGHPVQNAEIEARARYENAVDEEHDRSERKRQRHKNRIAVHHRGYISEIHAHAAADEQRGKQPDDDSPRKPRAQQLSKLDRPCSGSARRGRGSPPVCAVAETVCRKRCSQHGEQRDDDRRSHSTEIRYDQVEHRSTEERHRGEQNSFPRSQIPVHDTPSEHDRRAGEARYGSTDNRKRVVAHQPRKRIEQRARARHQRTDEKSDAHAPRAARHDPAVKHNRQSERHHSGRRRDDVHDGKDFVRPARRRQIGRVEG